MTELDEQMKRFEGNFLEVADLYHRGPVTLAIEAIAPPNTLKDKKKRLINKAVITFKGATKQMIANATNVRILKVLYGNKASGWIGKPVTITVRFLIESFGDWNVPCLRFAVPDGTPLPASVRKYYGKATPYTDAEINAEKQQRRDRRQ